MQHSPVGGAATKIIDRLERQLTEAGLDPALHAVSDGNAVRVIDTPRMWGKPMTKSSATACASTAMDDLAATVLEIVGRARRLVDVVSLNPPTGALLEAVKNGLLSIAERGARSGGGPVLVRFLFGYIPVLDEVNAFTKELSAFCASARLPMDRITIVVGQLYSVLETSWNHAKIVAADSETALVGGHNLWAESYGTYPPVHDLSVHVLGKAAGDAQRFADYAWRTGGKWITAYRINPGKAAVALPAGKERDAVCLVQLPIPTDGYERLLDAEWRHGRILTLGRGGLLKGDAGGAARVAVIRGARRRLRICQQDLAFTGFVGEDAHEICQEIARALFATPALKVEIVVSPIGAATHGAQYSWGFGASGTHALLKKFIRAHASSHGLEKSVDDALRRLAVAPFCFTDVEFTAEGKDYVWPEAPATSVIGRFVPGAKTPTLANHQPAPGNHAKLFMADEEVCYVGSDNLYPHSLTEFGFLLEGSPVENLITDYWMHVWRYSSPHIVEG
ncbi:hypothetical protein [Actinomadura flavalba]|uniref:hypothetical protein n=1 Tax=Actinomadura flavalba TaxID=1120938 RepID=UPI00037BF755|nr:hypothetical protein [Actinomadura flavalba]